MVAADLNADAFPDIAGVRYDGSLVLLPGRGDGRFGAVQVIASGVDGTQSILVSDLNGDGRADLLGVGTDQRAILAFLGRGDGRFDRVPPADAGPGIASLSIANLDGDAWPDLLVAHRCVTSPCAAGGLSLLRGLGDGQFMSIENLLDDESVEGAVALD